MVESTITPCLGSGQEATVEKLGREDEDAMHDGTGGLGMDQQARDELNAGRLGVQKSWRCSCSTGAVPEFILSIWLC